ncbi:hypothetical protein BSL78_27333 [Apostichopus japonicus]|uniref:RING-type E3 ubiquitin transferase n=1 Tax=Stichopus japonicus TaxID=307972 RepID=A0A2G8JJB2_STIJA|nr:hypothetical protein BSL78_27333 [Apostichopus japonicus]
MPIQAPQWTDFLTCPVCLYDFDDDSRLPLSLGCGHSICQVCIDNLSGKLCPFDQATITDFVKDLVPNISLLQLLNLNWEKLSNKVPVTVPLEHHADYTASSRCIEALSVYLKPLSKANRDVEVTSLLSRPLQRKLVTLINCQLGLEDGRVRAVRSARSIGERTVTELILQHQNGQISTNLWAAVRARGCQFLGPAMQEETLKLVLLALDNGAAFSRKVLVLFVVQRLEQQFPQASKTSVGHVVQLLYRASCFKVTKREEESSLMELKEEFRQYDALRKEHDTQIVQIAIEAGLRISPEQWSSLLYGDLSHKSHMQSIIDKLQTPESFASSIRELTIALQRSSDPAQLSKLRGKLEQLAEIDQSPEIKQYTWEEVHTSLEATQDVVAGLVDFLQNHSLTRRAQEQQTQSIKYKTSMCRDIVQKGGCPRGSSCTFAHADEELERYRTRSRRMLTTMNRQNSRTFERKLDYLPSKENDLPAQMESQQMLASGDEGIGYNGHSLREAEYVASTKIGHPNTSSNMRAPVNPDPFKEPFQPDSRYSYTSSPRPEPVKTPGQQIQPTQQPQSPFMRPTLPGSPRQHMPISMIGGGQVSLEQRYMVHQMEPQVRWRTPTGSKNQTSSPENQSVDQVKPALQEVSGKSENLSLQQLQQRKTKLLDLLDDFQSPNQDQYSTPMSNLSLTDRVDEYHQSLSPSPAYTYLDDDSFDAWPHRSGLNMKATDSKYTTSISKVQRLHLQGEGNPLDENPTLGKHGMQEFQHMSQNDLVKTLEQEKNAASFHYERSSKIQMEIMRRNQEQPQQIVDLQEQKQQNQRSVFQETAFVRHPGPVSRKATTFHKTTGPVKVNAGSLSIAPVTLMQDCHVSPGIQSTPGVYDYFQTGLTWNSKMWDSLPPSKDQMTESQVTKATEILKDELKNVSKKIEAKHSIKSANDSFLLRREENALSSDIWNSQPRGHVCSSLHISEPYQQHGKRSQDQPVMSPWQIAPGSNQGMPWTFYGQGTEQEGHGDGKDDDDDDGSYSASYADMRENGSKDHLYQPQPKGW